MCIHVQLCTTYVQHFPERQLGHMIAMKLEMMLEYLDLADPVGVEVHSKILYACIHGDVFQETESKTGGEVS